VIANQLYSTHLHDRYGENRIVLGGTIDNGENSLSKSQQRQLYFSSNRQLHGHKFPRFKFEETIDDGENSQKKTSLSTKSTNKKKYLESMESRISQ